MADSRPPRPKSPPPAGQMWSFDEELNEWVLVRDPGLPGTPPPEPTPPAKYPGYEAGMPDSPPPAGTRWVKVPDTAGAYAPVPLGQTWEENQARPVYTPKKYYDWSPRSTAPAEPPRDVYTGNAPMPRPAAPYLPAGVRRLRPWTPPAWRWKRTPGA